jgi:hypothetical protein
MPSRKLNRSTLWSSTNRVEPDRRPPVADIDDLRARDCYISSVAVVWDVLQCVSCDRNKRGSVVLQVCEVLQAMQNPKRTTTIRDSCVRRLFDGAMSEYSSPPNAGPIAAADFGGPVQARLALWALQARPDWSLQVQSTQKDTGMTAESAGLDHAIVARNPTISTKESEL